MTRHLVSISAVLFAALLVAYGQGADEKYIWIYTLIQEADSLSDKGQGREAAGKYADAMGQLKELQRIQPDWNPKIVNYRLSYLTSRLEALGPQESAPGAKLNVALDLSSKAGATNAAASSTNSPAMADPQQIKGLQEEIARLNDQNALLQAKLKEALSVQPAGVDPRQMAKAEEQIKALQKEKEELQAKLQQEQAKLGKVADSAVVSQEREIVEEIKQRLLRQMQLTEALQQENANLKWQVAQLRTTAPLPTDKANEQLQVVRAMVAILQATNIALRSEQIVLETRLAELAKSAVPKSAFDAARRENEELRKQLATAQAQGRGTSSNGMSAEELEKQLQIARARLEAFEAKAIPYTEEEKALFKQPDKKIDVTEVKPAKKPIELPTGAGPLVAEAERAFESGRLQEAERIYLDILRQDEKNLYTLVQLGSVQMNLGHFTDAEKTIERALAVDPQQPLCLYMKGYLRLQQNKIEEAFDALSLAAKVLPDEARTQYLLGKVLLQKGAPAQAETALRKAVQLKPQYREAHYSLALIYSKQKPPLKELAQWHYRKATNLGYPVDPVLEKELQEGPAVSSAR